MASFNQTVAASATCTPSKILGIRKTLSFSSTCAFTYIRSIAKKMLFSPISTPVATKKRLLPLSVSVSSEISLYRNFWILFAIASTCSATLSLIQGRLLSFGVTSTVGLTEAIQRVVTILVNPNVGLSMIKKFYKNVAITFNGGAYTDPTLTVSSTKKITLNPLVFASTVSNNIGFFISKTLLFDSTGTLSSIIRGISKTITFNSTGVLSITKTFSFNKLISVAVNNQIPAIVDALDYWSFLDFVFFGLESYSSGTTQTPYVTLSKQVSYKRAIIYNCSTLPSVVKGFVRTLTFTAASSVTLGRAIGKIFTITSNTVLTFTKSMLYNRVINTSSTGTVSFSKTFIVIISVVSSVAMTIKKSIAMTLTVTVYGRLEGLFKGNIPVRLYVSSPVGILVNASRCYLVTILTDSVGYVTMSKMIGKVLVINPITTVSTIALKVRILIIATASNVAMSMQKAIAITLVTPVAVTYSVIKKISITLARDVFATTTVSKTFFISIKASCSSFLNMIKHKFGPHRRHKEHKHTGLLPRNIVGRIFRDKKREDAMEDTIDE